MKLIPLTQGLFTMVDDADFDRLVAMGAWHIDHGYAARRSLVSEAGYPRRLIYMHQVLLGTMGGDHVDRNRLNNQSHNLRSCTASQNMCNRASWGKTSKYKGVSWASRDRRWLAQISLNRKSRVLGRYLTEWEAAISYNYAAKSLHGDRAVLNLVVWETPRFSEVDLSTLDLVDLGKDRYSNVG